jgi:hypothetical protein
MLTNTPLPVLFCHCLDCPVLPGNDNDMLTNTPLPVFVLSLPGLPGQAGQ